MRPAPEKYLIVFGPGPVLAYALDGQLLVAARLVDGGAIGWEDADEPDPAYCSPALEAALAASLMVL